MRAFIGLALAVAWIGAGCTAVLGADRHRGGEAEDAGPADAGPADAGPDEDGGPALDGGAEDAGPPDAGCDRDGDGYLAIDCGGDDCDDDDPDVYPNAPPICGNGRVEACPGSSVPAAHFGGSSAGLAPPLTLRDVGGHGREIALGTVPSGGVGFGTGVVLFVESGGARRLDVPLNRFEGAETRSIRDAADEPLTGVRAVSASPDGENRLSVAYTGEDEFWVQRIDFLSGDGALVRREVVGIEAPVAVDGSSFLYRRVDDPDRRLEFQTFGDGPPLGLSFEGPEVPAGWARTWPIGGYFAMQPAGEEVEIWRNAFDQTVAPLETSLVSGMVGLARAAAAASTSHWGALPRAAGAVEIGNIDCGDSGCGQAVIGGSLVEVRTGADAVDVPDVVNLPDDGRVALFIERRATRDRLTVQPITSDGRIAAARFELFDTPTFDASALRLLDARASFVATAEGTTFFVAALVGEGGGEGGGEGEAILATAVRTCTVD